MVSLLTVVGGVALIFTVAYLTYGRYMSRMFDLDEDRPTPAHDRYDGVDYVPSRKLELFGHHFSSVAGGAPIIGPITAALAWGWAPALAWIVVGTIVYGAMNDFAVLTMSVRHDGRSVGHIFGQYVGERGKSLMLSLAFTANLLVIGVLSLVVAIVFDAYPSTATASVCYVVLALLFGLYKRYGLPFRLGTLLFVPAVFGGVWVGLQYPLVLVSDGGATVLPTVVNANVSVWLVVILLYAFFASVLPVQTLLQPRDYLSSFLLYAGLGGAVLAIVVGTLFGTANQPLTMSLDPFTGFMSDAFAGIGPAVPMLFPTIFCGAVCGLHSMVCSGTTPKQLNRETDANAIGYGTTLVEGLLAVVAIGTVAVIPSIPSGSGIGLALPSFAEGGAIILSALGVPTRLGATFMALVLSAFALTTVDTSIRLGRYFVEDVVTDSETSFAGNRFANSAAQTALAYLLVASGSWAAIWPLFGGAVQVFAGLSIVTVVVWVRNWDAGKEVRSLLAGAAFVLATSLSALGYLAISNLGTKLLNPAWLGTASPIQIASVAVQVVVVGVLGALTVEILRIAAGNVSFGVGRSSTVREPGD
ncbi:carbon starvation protein A (plasmid) [Halococcus dombrowskii]|uniref:Carbon starvation protein A n=1 Tax=Halococcus dombrowskii TaxID=179637 RepID=A0AAV3SHB7_HALDO|nr:carbon starvation CstA family protein [Halococcus dombrowskii]UOO97471.1 carbon starvation protein A [Halococcus dombrowskii]